ncbi:MAG TPA: hypothetical protein VKZ63_10730, partial [Kofleriaceae bacterium]|nr:hypothetical protein [Kofleriaceae bacterium]
VITGHNPAAGQAIGPKHVVAPEGVDGPDDDDVATLYRADSALMMPMVAMDGGSYQRIRLEEGHELAAGGNGVSGHDETSENTRATWEQDVGTVPTPGEVPVPLGVECP